MRELALLTRRITRAAAHVRVEGPRQFAPGNYTLGCTDLSTGIPFTLRSIDEWADREKEIAATAHPAGESQ